MKLKTLITTLGIGAGLMYFLDPQHGERRRTMVRDKANDFVNNFNDSIDTAVENARTRARGVLTELTAKLGNEGTTDWILEERVRNNLGRIARGVNIRADGGRITLTGPVLRDDEDVIVKTAMRTRGVYGVENQLQPFDNPEDIPSLQAEAAGQPLRPNLSPTTRVLSSVGGSLLTLYGLTRRGVLRGISFKLHAGEVLGIAGLVGAGRTELARAIMGADPIDSGTIRVFGKELKVRSPRDAIQAGIAFLTENRKEQGLILIQSIAFNTTLVRLEQHARFGVLRLKAIRAVAERLAKELQIRSPSINRLAGELSGGNQQKVVVAKWLASQAKIFIFDEPTRGIDVGAKVEVYNLINNLVREGAAVIIICSEMPEVIGMSDRILVMHNGSITGEFGRDQATQEKIMYAALGARSSLEM